MIALSSIRTISASRWIKLIGGLACFGLGSAFMKKANLGLSPWDVLNDGLAQRTGEQLGTASIIIGVLVLLLWIPMRERPGIGTVANTFLVGIFINLCLPMISSPELFIVRSLWTSLGVALVGCGSALYLGSQLGAGPRDGLMLGLHRRSGWSLRLTRTTLEVVVLIVGYFLGGRVGLGTLAYAFTIGPVMQWFMRVLHQNVITRPVEV